MKNNIRESYAVILDAVLVGVVVMIIADLSGIGDGHWIVGFGSSTMIGTVLHFHFSNQRKLENHLIELRKKIEKIK